MASQSQRTGSSKYDVTPCRLLPYRDYDSAATVLFRAPDKVLAIAFDTYLTVKVWTRGLRRVIWRPGDVGSVNTVTAL